MSLPTRERGLKYLIYPPLNISFTVAPYAGAWIEIVNCIPVDRVKRSLPTRERGLKYGWCVIPFVEGTVAPYAGAWIEITKRDKCIRTPRRSLPTRERGLKCISDNGLNIFRTSLPTRERGLKSMTYNKFRKLIS